MNVRIHLLAAGFAVLAAPAASQPTAPPPPPVEEEEDLGEIVVTSTRVRQGGAQDIRHFRDAAADVGMPRPESLTIEGLMGEHDLDLKSTRPCAQLFCLTSETMAASLPGRPEDKLFVGLGFTSNIDADRWQREPLHLVAVVDKSGSMSGQPLDLVRRSLRQIAGQMRGGDRMSIVLYGDTSHLYLPPTDMGKARAQVIAAIDAIQSAGSTNMEEGLKVGYDTAFAAAPRFTGTTRLMLFTDEQPNVGATDADSFMGMAEAASRHGIGLTTIGVGVQFDASLATRVSSVRGGNLFFVADQKQVETVFAKQLDTMVSELAHDVRITMKPATGYRISGVFGVPDGLMTEGREGAMTITVPTAFLSTNGGGIFASLAKSGDRAHLPPARLPQGAPLMEVSLTYDGAQDKAAGSDRLDVGAPSVSPGAPLRLAHLLVDEFLTLKGATTAFHTANDPRKAHSLLSGIAARIDRSGLSGLAGERKLVGDMLGQAAFYAGYTGEAPRTLRHLAVVGTWRVSAASGMEDVASGDRMTFTDDKELITLRRKPGARGEAEETEQYRVNARQIYLPQSRLVFNFDAEGDRMVLREEDGRARIVLARVTGGAP